jgi:hypothetical protein
MALIIVPVALALMVLFAYVIAAPAQIYFAWLDRRDEYTTPRWANALLIACGVLLFVAPYAAGITYALMNDS